MKKKKMKSGGSNKYFLVYKPFNMLCKFTNENSESQSTKKVLSDLSFNFPINVYPLGRLDADSEGLLILSDDKKLNHLLLNPHFQHSRSYLAQVEGDITDQAISKLERGVEIKIDSKIYLTKPCKSQKIDPPSFICQRDPPIRLRKNSPTSWVSIVLNEGKNRQIRKMLAVVGFPCLRLIRIKIEDLDLFQMQPGEVKQIEKNLIYKLLKINER